jgi:hypothetical protein
MTVPDCRVYSIEAEGTNDADSEIFVYGEPDYGDNNYGTNSGTPEDRIMSIECEDG